MEHTVTCSIECNSTFKIDKDEHMDYEDTILEVDVKVKKEQSMVTENDVQVKKEESLVTENDVHDVKVVVKKEPEDIVATENELEDEKAKIKSSGFIHNCFAPCRSRFTRKCYLEIHLKRHSSLTYCIWCSKDFKSSTAYLKDLSQHLKSKAKEHEEEKLFCFHCCSQHASKKALLLHARTYCTQNKKNQKKREEERKRKKPIHEERKNIQLPDNEIAEADVKLEAVENVIEKYGCEFEDSPEYITISALTDLTGKEPSEVRKVDITVKKEKEDVVEQMVEENDVLKEEIDQIDYKAEENALMQGKDDVEGSEDIGDLIINSDLWRTPPYPSCEVCGAKFRYMASKNIHRIVHNTPMECTLCDNLPIGKLREFKSHVFKHLKQKESELRNIELQCPYCGLKFSNRKVVILHMRTHTNERPFKCDICGNAFKQINSLNTHLVTHSKEKAFICKECGGEYTTSSSLKRHIKRLHNMQRSIKCGHCSMKFQNIKAAQEHRMEAHVNKLFKRYCSLCNEYFFNKVSYSAHVKMHRSSL